ncbi:hypothetical protein KY290_035208 [Solanum tuberosum]|uniref:DUF3700 domain-containing protein n=1 Tax=Solanum tuberosum TaxID=4113 RepID=A0ABQ7U5G0_SOLTU|nr:hypothetical protein KY285_032900 [Solanum tuberosum]KAH0742165.1 hypothetical protein KY290_035208 [Solanum tuberosum]
MNERQGICAKASLSPVKRSAVIPSCLLAVVDDITCMTLRDRGPYPPDQVVKDIHGKFAFVLYDSASKSTFLADVDGSVPFFWGTDSEGHLVLSDDADIVKQGCGKLLKNDKSLTSVVNEMGGLLIRLRQFSFL